MVYGLPMDGIECLSVVFTSMFFAQRSIRLSLVCVSMLGTASA